MTESVSPIDVLETVAVKARVPSMMIGAPGTGKSAVIRALGERLGYRVIILVGSQMDSTDFAGMPQGRQLGETKSGEKIYGTINLSPIWQVRILKERKVILFLDEYSNTPPAIRAGFLTLIQDRVFPNGQTVPDETVIVGGMNPPDEAADGFQMDLPTKNRFFHIAWNPPFEEWFEGMVNNWGKKTSPEELMWKQKIVRFLRDNQHYVHEQPDDDDPGQTNVFARTASEKEVNASAWPSRRSWDNVSKALAVASDSPAMQKKIVDGLVGFKAGAGLLDWLRKNDVISPQSVIDDPTSVNWKTLSIDDSNLLFRSILNLASEDNALNVIAVFRHVADSKKANVAGPFISRLVRKFSASDPELKKAMMDLARSYSNVAKNA